MADECSQLASHSGTGYTLMSNFALDVNSSPGDIISSLNYALANLGTTNIDANVIINIAANVLANANVVTVNSNTGQLQSHNIPTISYINKYVNVKYANSASGSTGFTSNCTSATYYGVHNSQDGTISSNPTDYQWIQVSGGFGTTKYLFYTTAGGGVIYFSASSSPVGVTYSAVPDNTAISLQSLANSIVTTTTIIPGAVTNVGIAGNTVNSNNIQYGAITANLLAANLIIARDIVSTNATLGDYASAGYWMQANTGSARFGGSMSIGNNLAVGNNAAVGGNLNIGTDCIIGGNLSIAGLVTSGGLNTNTVSTTTIVANSTTATATLGTNTNYGQGGRQLTYIGYDSVTGFYYWADSNFLSANASSSNLTTTTSTIYNSVAAEITLSGKITANVQFSPYADAIINRYSFTTSSFTSLAGSTVQISPINLYNPGARADLTQTIFPLALVSVSNETYTAASTPEVSRFIWGYQAAAITTSYPANVYVFFSNVISQSINVTNLKR